MKGQRGKIAYIKEAVINDKGKIYISPKGKTKEVLTEADGPSSVACHRNVAGNWESVMKLREVGVGFY